MSKSIFGPGGLSFGQAQELPANWGFPGPIYNYRTRRYKSGGMVWLGPSPATPEDIAAILSYPRAKEKIDRLTLCGRDDPNWTTWAKEKRKNDPAYSQKIVVR